MTYDSVERIIAQKMKNFEESINLPCGYGSKSIVNALNNNPRLMVYVAKVKISGGVAQITYCNQDLDSNDVYIAPSVAEAINVISRYIGNFKKQVWVVADSSLPLEEAVSEFHKNGSVTFPNYRTVTTKRCKFDKSTINRYEFEYRIDSEELGNMDGKVDAEVERISKLLFLPGMPPETKAYLAHNYLATTVSYYGADVEDPVERSYVQSAYGALINKRCVCQGYAEAFKRLMDEACVPCHVVRGQIIGSTEHHAWNIVKLRSSERRHVDVTWDASKDKPRYDYFGKDDAFFDGKRTWKKSYYGRCLSKDSLLDRARSYIISNKDKLIKHGIPNNLIDV